MSTLKKILVLFLLAAVSQLTTPKKALAQYATVSLQVFYDELSPFGTWIDYPEYGYVWMPAGYAGFSPYYSNGYWAYTHFGWTWVSYYPWGWAPFHYGRWMLDPFYGWVWLPDSYWGPAWVVWRSGGGYCGWAPMGAGASVSFSFSTYIPNEHWVFVEEKHLGEKNISAYYGPRTDNKTFMKNTDVIKNTYHDKTRNTKYVTGPYREEVEKISGKTIKPVALKESDRPGQKMQGDQLTMYRPVVKTTNAKGERPAPAKSVKPENRNNDNLRNNRDLEDKGREPEKTPPSRKDRIPVPNPGEVNPPKETPPANPRELPQANPRQQRPIPESPRHERPQVIPPRPGNPQPAPKPEIHPRPNHPVPGNRPGGKRPAF